MSTDALRATTARLLAEGATPVLGVSADRSAPGWLAFWTEPTPVQDLEAGDVYIVGTVGGKRESRRVLEVFPRALGSAVLYVEDPRGDTFRAHVSGRVEVLQHA